MSDNVTSIIDTLTELQRMHQLNLELLEQLHVATDWLLSHNIPLPNAETLYSLFQKSKSLLVEIQADSPKTLIYQKLSDDWKHPNKSDDKVPVPICIDFCEP
jgi:hypothetical protein